MRPFQPIATIAAPSDVRRYSPANRVSNRFAGQTCLTYLRMPNPNAVLIA